MVLLGAGLTLACAPDPATAPARPFPGHGAMSYDGSRPAPVLISATFAKKDQGINQVTLVFEDTSIDATIVSAYFSGGGVQGITANIAGPTVLGQRTVTVHMAGNNTTASLRYLWNLTPEIIDSSVWGPMSNTVVIAPRPHGNGR
jgi:hypothetical protein